MAEIAVLIPHYNCPDALIKSLKSIKEDLEVDVFVIDDGSKNMPKAEDLHFYRNGKIFLDGYDKNKGIEYALNFGLKKIINLNYPYIARLDCADTCSENRFKYQLEYLKQHKNIDFIGSWVKFVNENNKLLYLLEMPKDHETIKNKSYFNAMFIHPTIFFRRKVIENVGYYPTNYPAAEDQAFFFKVLKKHTTANCDQYLVNVEVNSHGISSLRRKTQVKSRIKIIIDHFYFGYYPILGLIRNIILLIMPRKIIIKLKSLINKNNAN